MEDIRDNDGVFRESLSAKVWLAGTIAPYSDRQQTLALIEGASAERTERCVRESSILRWKPRNPYPKHLQ